MGWKEKLDTVRDVASGTLDAIRANDGHGRKSCRECGTYLGGGGDLTTCPYCGKDL